MEKDYEQGMLIRTLQKMIRSQKEKKKLLKYIEENAPHLLGNHQKITRIKECCNYLKFVDFVDGRQRLHTGNFCKYDKLCLACATRRSIKKIQSFISMIQRNERENKYWYHITLTIRHSKIHSLEYLMGKLLDCRKRMAQGVRNARRDEQNKESFFAKFDGMVASIEVTHGKNGWHPHMHMLVCSDAPVEIERSDVLGTKSNRELQKERYSITSDSYCVAMREITVDKHHYERQGIAEVFKYAIKFSTLSIDKHVELLSLQKKNNYKFYSTYGIFRGKEIKEKIKGRRFNKIPYLIENENIFTFNEVTQKYQLRQ